MNLIKDKHIKHVHCIGLGGIGVSALAEILIKNGFSVSGSDVHDSQQLDYLRSIGITVFIGHRSHQVDGADMVVYSSAINSNNPEFLRAVELGVHLIKRGRLLADLMELYQSVAVSGTHGKTTTTAILSHVLTKVGIDPTFFIGGIPRDRKSPVHIGNSEIFVAEADESDASFLFMQPKFAIVTNIECDHMSTYAGSESELCQSFGLFLNRIPAGGAAVLCADDPNIQKLLPELHCDVVTYGEAQQADYVVMNYRQDGLTGHATIKSPQGEFQASLSLPGFYNMKNATAAIIVAVHLGVDIAQAIETLKSFAGVGRRFQFCDEVYLGDKHVTIYEDYGHHPTEVRETYRAAVQAFLGRRVVLVFQPHRYTRTRDLMREFVEVLKDIDCLVLLPTYAASEDEISDSNSEALCSALKAVGKEAHLVESNEKIYELLDKIAQNDDVIFFQGAGDVSALARNFRTKWEELCQK